MNVDSERKLFLFEAARELTDPARRRAFLQAECGEDMALLAKIEKLASAGECTEEFFADCIPTPAAISAALESSGILGGEEGGLLGSRFGSYKLLQRIGEGGCGVVYMAEQMEPIRRRVALKIIKLGMDTKSVIARFEAERQTLAIMEHPNIARVFDAGATETGRPYFVMELVAGVRITEYCDENQFGLQQRLEIFIQICHAIQHAHQKGIIHRDIKPSNILVTMHDSVPVPKVIDFGIAKATEEQLTDKTLVTTYAQLIGTPAYMSPEQLELSGLDLDTRSDIYSLGVLMYELLTGRTPFDTKELLKSGVDEMRRTLRECDPCSPSVKLHTLGGDELTRTAIQRKVGPPQMVGLLRGDLDWIVMKALEKDRTRRYETADALATDVRRYLDDEPILARPPSRWYQFQKLVRRNRIVFSSAAAVSAALLVGIVVSTRLYFKERTAEREQAMLRQAAESQEKLTQAALLAAQQDFADAEKLLDGLDLNKPSLELATLLRSLGDWHALNGEWRQAVERFGLLVKADQQDSAVTTSVDYTKLAAALIESGDSDAYQRDRQAAITRFQGVTDQILDRIVKVSLLVPANPQTLKDIQPLADAARNTYEKLGMSRRPSTVHAAWIAMSLALLEYRRGNYAMAAQWCQQCLATPRFVAPGTATADVILAMSCWRMNQKALALSQWSTGAAIIEAEFKKKLTMGSGTTGFWYDWIIARTLSRECERLFTEADPSGAAASGLQPSPDTAATWRALGEWHAFRNEWRKAADCYASTLRLDQFDSWKDSSADHLSYAVSLAEAGDTAGYEHFREGEIASFKEPDTGAITITTTSIKSCLLRPADGKLLANLAPLAAIASRPFPGKWDPALLDFYDGWRSVSMSLLEFRRGDYAKSVDWSRHCLDCPQDIRVRSATARIILAMSLHELGQDGEARSELEQGRNIIDARFSSPLDHGVAERGLWYDWIIGRDLLSEATGLLAGSPAKALPAVAH